MKTFLLGAAALVTAAAPLAATAQPYANHPVAVANHSDRDGDHRWDRDDHRWGGGWNHGYGWNRGYYGYGYGYGYRGAAVAGLFGLALGATLASERPYYAPCHWVTQRYIGAWGRVNYRQVEVCR